jgi:predicted aconitase with swiveling domain
MKLTRQQRAWLDGDAGPAMQWAMDFNRHMLLPRSAAYAGWRRMAQGRDAFGQACEYPGLGRIRDSAETAGRLSDRRRDRAACPMTGRQGFSAVLTGGRGVGGEVRAPVLVSRQGFGVRYDLDQATGIISNPEHDLFGETITGRILIFSVPKGGVAASWSLARLNERGIAPAGMILRRASPIFVQEAIFAGIPLMDSLSGDPCSVLRTGEDIILAPGEGRVWARR